MSDYLSNLAGRSLATVATIRPRLASFYESPQRGFGRQAEAGAEIAEERDAPAASAQSREVHAVALEKPAVPDAFPRPIVNVIADEIQPRAATITTAAGRDETSVAAAAPPPPRFAADRLAASPFTPSPEDVVREPPRAPEHREVAPAITAPDHVDGTRHSPSDVEVRHQRRATRITPAQFVNAQPHVAKEPPVLAREPLIASELPSLSHKEITRSAASDFAPSGSPPRREHSGAEIPELELPSRLPAATPHRITPSRIIAESQPAFRVPPMPRSIRPDRQPAAAPDVHITIGRVEVRAVAAAEPAPRARSAAPAAPMNLDDYLRRRDKRGRR
jgi:hypothetical protein